MERSQQPGTSPELKGLCPFIVGFGPAGSSVTEPIRVFLIGGLPIFGLLVKLRFPRIEHGYGKVVEVLDIPSH